MTIAFTAHARTPVRAGLFALLVAAAAGCSQAVGPRDAAVGRDAPAVEGSTPPPDADTPAPPFTPAPAPGTLRLTASQYRSTVRDLLGGEPLPDVALPADPHELGYSTVGVAGEAGGLTAPQREQYAAAASALAAAVANDAARRAALLGCAPASAADPCVRAFVARFGRLAFRRAPVPSEVDRLAATAAAGTSVADGVQRALAEVLASDAFLLRTQRGEAAPAGSPAPWRFTSTEMASRLSYFVWNSAPDSALLDAGERGELTDAGAVQAQLARMLADPRARRGLGRFFTEYLYLERLDALERDPARYPQFTPALRGAMRAEPERMLDALVFGRDEDFRNAWTTRVTFVDGALASLYGLAGVAGTELVQVELPASSSRAGLLGTAGVLALHSSSQWASPTRRGLFVRSRVLCQEIPPSPPDIPVTPPHDTGGTFRERLTASVTGSPACMGCHRLLDPIGFALENFDALGQYRTAEAPSGLPIDARGELDGAEVEGPAQLGAAIARDPRAPRCLVVQLYRYANARDATAGEAPVLDALAREFAVNGFRFARLATQLAASEGFRFTAAPR